MKSPSSLTLFVLLLFTPYIGHSNKPEIKEVRLWNADIIKGNVKQIITTNYTRVVTGITDDEAQNYGELIDYSKKCYNKQGLLVEESKYTADSMLFEKQVYSYDNEQRLIKREHLTSSSQLYSTYVFTYEQGLEVKQEVYYYYNEEQPCQTIEQTYNQHRNISTYTLSKNSEAVEKKSYTYTYNKQQQVETQLEHNELDKSETLKQWTYNNNEQIVAIKHQKGSYVVMLSFKYHQNGFVEEEAMTDSHSSSPLAYTYSFDENDDMVRFGMLFKGKISGRSQYYKYDEHGNWVLKTEDSYTDMHGKRRKDTINRTIEYY